MPARPFPLRRSRRNRPRPHHRMSPLSAMQASPARQWISHCLLRRAGSICCGHPRGADGRQGPGSHTCLGRHYHLQWPPVAWSGGYYHWWISVPAILGQGQAQGDRRSPPSMAALRAHHQRVPTRMGLSGKRRQSYQHRLSRGPRRAGRAGLSSYGRIVYGGRSRRAAQATAAVCSGPRRMFQAGETRHSF